MARKQTTIVGDAEDVDAVDDLTIPDDPVYETPEEALRDIVQHVEVLGRTRKAIDDTKATLKKQQALLTEQERVRDSKERALRQLKLFKGMVILFGLLSLGSCSDALQDVGVGGSLHGWEDEAGLQIDVFDVEPGLAVAVDRVTHKRYLLAGTAGGGCPHSFTPKTWHAIEPLDP